MKKLILLAVLFGCSKAIAPAVESIDGEAVELSADVTEVDVPAAVSPAAAVSPSSAVTP